MVKFGKQFRKVQNQKWRDKYINYKSLKKFIKKCQKQKEQDHFSNDAFIVKLTKKNVSPQKGLIVEKINLFSESLDLELKKVFIFFAKEEKSLYHNLNQHLYQKDDYPQFYYNEYIFEIQQLETLSQKCLSLSKFVLNNFIALIKILKKFDKKVIGEENDKYKIKFNYIKMKIEEQNSDLLYMYNFQIIDQVCALLEELLKRLKSCFDLIKNNRQSNISTGSKKEILIRPMSPVEFYKTQEQAIQTLNQVDAVISKVKALLTPWDNFINISGQIIKKLYEINKENNIGFEGSDDDFKNDGNVSIMDILTEDDLNQHQLNKMGSLFIKKKSFSENVFISKQNKRNIYLIFLHCFFYMISISNGIPFCTYYFIQTDQKELKNFTPFILSITPLGILVSLCINHIIVKNSTKFPIILSCIFLMLGNIAYSHIFIIENFHTLIVGRFCFGLGNIRVVSNTYIENFIPKQKKSQYYKYFRICSFMGLSIGLFVNYFSFMYGVTPKLNRVTKMFNEYTYVAWGLVVYWGFFLIAVCFIYTESFRENFISTELTLNGEQSSAIVSNNIGSDSNYNRNEHLPYALTISEAIKREKDMITDINKRIDKVNQEHNYNETNLVRKTIDVLASKEQSKFNFIFMHFFIYICLIFISNTMIDLMISYSQLIFSSTYKIDIKIMSLFQGGAMISLIIFDLIHYCLLYACKHNKIWLILMPLICLIINIIFMEFWEHKQLEMAGYMFISLIFANYLEKVALGYFPNILPISYSPCRVNGNLILNYIATFGQLIGASLPFVIESFNCKKIVFGVISGFCFICILFVCFTYKRLKEKALIRIIKGEENQSKEGNIIISTCF